MLMLQKMKTVISPKQGKTGAIELNDTCLLTDVLEIIKRLGFAPAPFNKTHAELAKGVSNFVISVEKTEDHPKTGKPSFPGFMTGGVKIHLIKGENLPMFTRIAVILKVA